MSANICKMTYVLNIFDLNWEMFFTRYVNHFFLLFSARVLGSMTLLPYACVWIPLSMLLVSCFFFIHFISRFWPIDSCFNFTMPISK